MSKQSKAAKVRAYQAKHPKATVKEIAAKCGTTPAYIYSLRQSDAKKQLAKVEQLPTHEPTPKPTPEPEKDSVAQTLEERGKRYGKFIDHATLTQNLKIVIHLGLVDMDKHLEADQQEALDMICHKIGRVVCGDADYADSWHDIAGYAQLVADRLNGKVQ